MKVLLVNHTSTISGAEHSLLGLLRAMPEGVDATLACPRGALADEAIRAGVRVEALPQTDGSLKLHPWHTPSGVASLARSAWRIRALAARHGADLVHANSIRAGLSANLATRLGAPPAVVHVRDCLPPGRVSSVLQRSVRRRSGAVVANSRYTLERFGCADNGFVVHNAVDPARFSPRIAGKDEARKDLGLEPGRPVLGVVAQLTPWKGQDVAIRALIRVREEYPDAVLLLAGAAKFTAAATRHDNLTYVNGLHDLVRSAGLAESVRFLGERDDVPAILAALDLLLLPSWEEPFGRAVIEAFAMGVPVIATDVGGTAEIVTEGSDGLLRPPRDVDAWAEAVVSLLGRPEVLRAMGERARHTALRRFTPDEHCQAVAAVYAHVAGDRLPARRGRPIFV